MMNDTYTYGLAVPERASFYVKPVGHPLMRHAIADNILINLNIISKIAPKDKIYVTEEGYISIDNSTIIQGVVRFLYNNSRSKSISNLSNFFSNVFETIDSICDIQLCDSKSRDKEVNNYSITGENTLLSYIRKSVPGIENLKQTYSNDVVITSKLDIIIDNIQRYSSKLERKIEELYNGKKILV